ncbi:hypothetical protein BC332_10395 [Capsicum chinense]|nr:hypothetical protein BC332_10395 [Capsicum chinense]
MSTLQSSNRIEPRLIIPSTKHDTSDNNPDTIIIAKLYTIREAIADRVEMHKNICEQRCQWNSMLLTSINCITLAAATITAIAITSTSPIFGLKLCSTLMYFAVTCMLVLLNQLQPSQLAEEQRNASRLFRNLLNQIDTTLSIGQPVSNSGVKMAMLSVLALDKAYPLPIIGTMLDKFPYIIEPAVWWPQQQRQTNSKIVLYDNRDDCDGWNGELEEEMRQTKSKIVNENRGDCNGWNGELEEEMRQTKSKIVNENRGDCNGWNGKLEEEMRQTKSKIVNENRGDCNGWNGKLDKEMRRTKSKIVNENRDDCNGWNEKIEEEMRRTKSKIVNENRDDCNGKLEEEMRRTKSKIVNENRDDCNGKLEEEMRQTKSKIVNENRDDCNGKLEEEMRQTKSKIVNENRDDCNGKLEEEMRQTKSKIVNENRDDCNGKLEEEMRQRKSKIVNENRDDCNGKLEEEMRQRKSKIVNENRDDCNGRNEELEEEIRQTKSKIVNENRDDCNGWNRKLEEDMREVAKILEKKDQEEYIRLATKALNLNKFLAVLGPVLTGLATIGSALVGSSRSWVTMIGVVPGALACIVNTMQHGGQVGMVFEMYRSNAGFFKYMKESIESNLMEKDVNKRENGEVFEMKLALKLGRSLCELRELANSYSSCKIEELDEFASKLF